MDKVKAYQIRNWKKYNITDTKKDFIAVLNILEAHGENLDTLHDAAFNGFTSFCGIVGRFENDRDTVRALFEFNTFYDNPADLAALIYYRIEDLKDDYTREEIDAEIKATFCDDENPDDMIIRTADGYVHSVCY